MSNKRKINIGDKFGELTIISELERKKHPNGRTSRVFECQCSCGNTVNVIINNLISGHSTKCGHCGRETKVINIPNGSRFGRLVTIKEVDSIEDKNGNKKRLVLCKCDCGNTKVIPFWSLIRSKSKSCGCLSKELRIERSTKHGLSNRHPLYGVWKQIKQRCYNENHHAYKDYGGRGIKMCDDWMVFEKFFHWCINNGWEKNKTIDRIDNNKGYNPNNCRLVTMLEQNRNKRNNKSIEYNGRKWNSLSEFCKDYKLPYAKVQQQLYRGWDLEKVLQKYNKI